ncbi:glycine cleavage system aminomethyltransferase GcvT [Phragmitibacter flavus]|uniref:Aminomethyltransferase n=1 Tax=Phragmitibacter flavus TaxID=2576071 RepID=A0A5R8KDD6_9BACT|nr:glycine cleavage system aminomethyltransferase GcvT [Phragmitibacter flavus]TLD70303.1 glycine cleavage system aminomethyltransferase GcvT [Phragmitibacter flavus]
MFATVSDTADLKRSPLHAAHLKLAARMVPFAGWEMPVQYSGIVEEHKAVRANVGVFDISHMGQFLVSGADAQVFLNRALTNDISVLAPGQGQYTLLLNDQGGVIDDLIAYRLDSELYYLVVNASMIDPDRERLLSLLDPSADIALLDLSPATGGLAIQGPKSAETLSRVLPDVAFPERNTIQVVNTPEGQTVTLCGTGYTGEKGFEFFAPAEHITFWFEKFVEAAQAEGGMPTGLGCRDTLRLEMGYPLNGNDLSPDKTPLEAGLGFFVSMGKPDFAGKSALETQKNHGLPGKLTGFRMTAPSPPPRAHYPVLHDGQPIGEICSGGLSPTLGQGIGMAYLPLPLAKPGTPLQIEIRGRQYAAETVKKPFHQPSNT